MKDLDLFQSFGLGGTKDHDPNNRRAVIYSRYVVFYAYDRFSREGGKAIVTKQELKDMGIVVKSATMPIDTSNPYGEGMEDMQLIFAKIENDIRRKRCMDGTRQKLLGGKWCGPAPVGYQWQDGQLLIDPKTGPLIKKAFEWKANEANITQAEIRARLAKRGLRLTSQTMSRVIRNPLYCGLIAHKILEGEVVPGNHPPIVSRKVFLRVNGILSDKNASGWRVDEENALLPLKRFLKCEKCGKPLTGYLNKTKNGKKRKRPIPYYKCQTSSCRVSLSANKMGDFFLAQIEPYQIDERWLPLIAQEFRATMAERFKDRFRETEALQRRLFELDKKIKRLRERYVLEESISKEDYREFTLQLSNQKRGILKELEKAKQKTSNPLNRIDEIIRFSAHIGRLWTNGDYRTKQMVQKFAFPDGMIYSKEKGQVLTPRINEVIRVSSQYSAILGQKGRGQVGFITNLPHLVVREGIEPPTQGFSVLCSTN